VCRASTRGSPARPTATKFFDKLVQCGYATASDCLHNRAALYHVHHQALYRAIGQPQSRYRRPVSAKQAIDRVRLLDGVISNPELVWLVTEKEKVAFFNLMAPSLPPERLPHIAMGKAARLSWSLPPPSPMPYREEPRASNRMSCSARTTICHPW
jgi:hypothetical protein